MFIKLKMHVTDSTDFVIAVNIEEMESHMNLEGYE
jgi:hypothetical protein